MFFIFFFDMKFSFNWSRTYKKSIAWLILTKIRQTWNSVDLVFLIGCVASDDLSSIVQKNKKHNMKE